MTKTSDFFENRLSKIARIAQAARELMGDLSDLEEDEVPVYYSDDE